MFKLSQSFELPVGAREIMCGDLAECLSWLATNHGAFIHVERDTDQTTEAYDIACPNGMGVALYTIVEV